jgi:hypothetical protein
MGDTVKVDAGRQKAPAVPQNISEQLSGQLTMHTQKVKEGDTLYLIINVSVDRQGKVTPLYDRNGDLQINVGKQRGGKVYEANGKTIDVPYIKVPITAGLDEKLKGGKQFDINALDWKASTKIDTKGFVGVSGPELKMPGSIEWQKAQQKEERKGPAPDVIMASFGRPNEFMAPPSTEKYLQAPATVGAKLKAQYEKGVADGVINAAGNFYIFRSWDKGSGGTMEVEETGIAYKKGDDYLRVSDGTKLKGSNFDVLLVKKGSDALSSIGKGTLDPKAGKGKEGWENLGKPPGELEGVRPVTLDNKELTGKIKGALMVENGRLTGYYAPRESDFKTRKGFVSEVKGEGSGVQNDGTVLRYHGGTSDAIYTGSGQVAVPEWSGAVTNAKWKGKYFAIVRGGEVLGVGQALDTGSGVGSHQIDYYQGIGSAAYDKARAITGDATFYFFNSQAAMEKALKAAGITFR